MSCYKTGCVCICHEKVYSVFVFIFTVNSLTGHPQEFSKPPDYTDREHVRNLTDDPDEEVQVLLALMALELYNNHCLLILF